MHPFITRMTQCHVQIVQPVFREILRHKRAETVRGRYTEGTRARFAFRPLFRANITSYRSLTGYRTPNVPGSSWFNVFYELSPARTLLVSGKFVPLETVNFFANLQLKGNAESRGDGGQSSSNRSIERQVRDTERWSQN